MIKTIYHLLQGLTDYPVIRAYSNGTEPKKPFLTYNLMLERAPTHSLYSDVDEDGKREVKTHIDAVLELQYFRATESEEQHSLAFLRDMAMKMQTQSQQDKWDNSGIALVSVDKLTHLPFLDEAEKYVDRSVLELSVRYTASAEDIIHLIETVKLDYRLDKLKGSQTIGEQI